MKASVQAMIDDPTAPIAPLAEFMAEYNEDQTLWHKISCDHHQQLFHNLLHETAEILAEKDRAEQPALLEAYHLLANVLITRANSTGDCAPIFKDDHEWF